MQKLKKKKDKVVIEVQAKRRILEYTAERKNILQMSQDSEA